MRSLSAVVASPPLAIKVKNQRIAEHGEPPFVRNGD
jgi:hypothetical protein